MSSDNSSSQDAGTAASLPEAINTDKDESSIKITANSKETSGDINSDSATETEDELEDEMNAKSSDDNEPKGKKSNETETKPDEEITKTTPDEEKPKTTPDEEKTKTTPDEEKPKTTPDEEKPKTTPDEEKPKTTPDEEKAMTKPDEEKLKTSDSSEDNTGRNNAESSKRTHIKLEEVEKFDILLPNEKSSLEVRKAKKDFYSGYLSYRKLIDRIRPVFMERDTADHKLKIGKWLVGKVDEKGGRFLKEDGDGTSGNCKVMTSKDSLEYTINAFKDNKPWTEVVSFIEGKEDENQPFAQILQGTDLESKLKASSDQQDTKLPGVPLSSAPSLPQSRPTSAEVSLTDASGSEPESVAKNALGENPKSIQNSSEPPLKKMKTGDTATMDLIPTSSSNVQTKSDQVLEDAKSSSLLQSCLRERQVIRAELTENQEILMMRQERLARLEAEFRLFQERQVLLPSERWLTEKILRQEEIFENRELFGIQLQRCRRLQTLLELNERQMFEQQSMMGREKLKAESLRSIKEQGLSLDNMVSRQDSEAKKGIVKEILENDDNTRLAMEIEKRKQQIAAQRVLDQHLALEAEMQRRAALEQKTAMEQEIQYRQAMEHAVKRQAAMKHAMEARQVIMAQADILERSSEARMREASISGNVTQKASPDVTESMGDKNDTGKGMEIGCNEEVAANEGKKDANEEEEEDDDDYLII